MNTRRMTLDLSKQPASLPVLRIGAGDRQAPTLVAEITDHGAAFPLSGYTATFEMRKPSGGAYVVMGTKSGNTATFKLDGMEPGSGFAYVALENESTRLSTQRFRVEVLEGMTR